MSRFPDERDENVASEKGRPQKLQFYYTYRAMENNIRDILIFSRFNSKSALPNELKFSMCLLKISMNRFMLKYL